ncbi:hypothetical protein [Anaerosporobacter sp.]|uniref:hypothetical protein n=1 Tax=Anaerosporobacter sp. TaxID=1872529 RepID=UPI00286FA5A0|nr:hypothetical protein [Anaerosporobacter sp.]
MNKRIVKDITRKVLIGLIVVTLASNPVMTYAASEVTKDENVYADLSCDGTVNGIYVVNSYELTSDETILDYGNYSSVKNLSSEQSITMENSSISIDASKGMFYYQGNLETKELPWIITITYQLDGEAIAATELAGREGTLKIFLSIKQNVNIDTTFFEHYLMQVTVTLDAKRCENIKADGATIANVGNDKQLLYTIMPNSESEVEISCDITDFRLEPITFKAVASNIEVETNSIDTSVITEETSKITDAAGKLDDASNKVADGVEQLQKGAKQLEDAITKLDSKSQTLKDGSAKVLEALKVISAQLESVSISSQDLNKLITASSDICTGINGLQAGVKQLDNALIYSNINKTIWSSLAKQTGNQITQENRDKLATAITSQDIVNQVMSLPDGELKQGMIAYITASQSYVTIEQAYQTGLQTYMSTVRGSVKDQTGSAYLVASTEKLSENYKEFDKQIKKLGSSLSGLADNMTTLKTAINSLTKEYTTLDGGIVAYANGVSAILTGVTELESGLETLQEGTNELRKGTSEFLNQTSDIDGIVEDKIESMVDSMTGGEFEVVSFVSDKNTNVGHVQFVMETEEIKKPEEVKAQKVEEKKSFFEKLRDLF